MTRIAATADRAAVPFLKRLGTSMAVSTRSRYADFLPEAQAIAAREASPIARILVLVIAALFAMALTWAWFSEIEQVATAPAVVRPAGKVKIVNHPEGGRIAAILVREGELVTKGQKLIEFDRGAVREEVARRTTEWLMLVGEATRLDAEARGRSPEFPPVLTRARPDLVRAQIALYETRRRALISRRNIADRVIEQRDREAGAIAARLQQFERSLGILQQQERAVGELVGKGYFPRLRHLSIKRQISDQEGQVSETSEAAIAAFSALSEARTRRINIDEEWRSEILGRLAGAKRDAEIARSVLRQEQGRRRNLVLYAPTAGVVQNIAVASPGQSVSAYQTLLNIVPSQEGLIIEALVSNDDIGYVHVGQKTTIKVQTYDFIRYGTLSGVVEHIAADATEDKKTGTRNFVVLVKADRNWLSDGDRRMPVHPGMQVSIDLRLGQRSILSYLTDRISRTAQSAFKER